MQVCEADELDDLITSLDQLTTELLLLTNEMENGTLACACSDDIILLLEFIVKWAKYSVTDF